MTDFAPYFQTRFAGTELSLDGISISRGETLLFSELGLTLRNGDLLWVAGSNGVGKTTLLRICAGLLRPDAGELAWQIDSKPSRAEDCVDFQTHQGHAKSGLTLAEDFAFWAKITTRRAPDLSALQAVGLSGALNTPAQHLSAGQKRRLSLARLLVNNRPIWIMDEPMAGLDIAGRDLVMRITQQHLARGGIALIASHNPADIAGPNVRRLSLEPIASPAASAA